VGPGAGGHNTGCPIVFSNTFFHLIFLNFLECLGGIFSDVLLAIRTHCALSFSLTDYSVRVIFVFLPEKHHMSASWSTDLILLQ
jgi:hypothetical protein